MAFDKFVKLSQVGIIKDDSDASYDAKGSASAVLGTAADTASANTVYGAKAKAADVQSAVVGESGDASSASTVFGAKKKAEEEAAAVLGTASDTAASNTVYGAKAKAADVQSAITGTAADTADDLTLNGLKKAVADAAANIPDAVVTEDELDGKGYQTATQVTSAIEGYGYQDAQAVQSAIGTALSSVMDWKGAKATKAELPSAGNKKGDVWHVTADSSEYAWNGEGWDELGVTFDASGYVQSSEIVFATDDEVRRALGQAIG